jgi:molecular chaperone HtpG
VKEGLVAHDVEDKAKLLELVIAPSTADADKPATLADYVGRMKEGQKEIYVLSAPTLEAARKSPLLEGFTKKGYEVLLFADPIDEIWLENPPEYAGHELRSVGRGAVELGSEEERKQESEALETKQKEYGDLLSCLRVHLQREIKEVRLSSRLTSSAACLVGDEHDMSPRVQRMLEQLGQKAPPVKRILELNPNHPLIEKLKTVFAANNSDPRLKLYAELLLGQGHLAESGQVPDPLAFSQVLADVMLQAV